jgi:hypothetical protein
MYYRFQTAFCILGILCGSICLAQNYKCDWSVNGIGGGDMAGAYKCGSTAGQTAAGLITGSDYWALIGFWQPEGQVGVREAAQWPSGPVVETRLYAPQPNPSRAAALRYALAVAGNVSLSVHDLTGRQVRVLVNSQQKPGRYNVRWNGCDHLGRSLANGVYFCRFSVGDYRATEKLVLQR